MCTIPKYSRLQKSCNKQAEQWKTTIDLLCLNREVGHAEAGKITIFICGKSIMVFHCSACLLQDFCNLLYVEPAAEITEMECNIVRGVTGVTGDIAVGSW